MLRYFEVTEMKPIPAEYAASADMVTGMLATIDASAGEVKIADGTAANVYFVNKERYASGIYASRVNYDDYFEQFVNIKAGEMVKLVPLFNGCLYGSDQHGFASVAEAEAAVKGKTLQASAGKLVAATEASRLMCEGAVVDGEHVLLKVRVLDTPVANG